MPLNCPRESEFSRQGVPEPRPSCSSVAMRGIGQGPRYNIKAHQLHRLIGLTSWDMPINPMLQGKFQTPYIILISCIFGWTKFFHWCHLGLWVLGPWRV